MTTTSNNKPDPDAADFLTTIGSHTLLMRALVSVAEQGIPDLLGNGPATAAELAALAGLHESTLYRILRFLASYGIFREDEAGRFHLTPRANALRTGVPGSLRDRVRGPLQDLLWRSYEKLPHMLRNGHPAFDQAHGQPFFAYLAAHPEINEIFDRNMAHVSDRENPLVAASYPFDRHGVVVDVGGGRGGLLAAILDRHPNVRGVLFDQPQVVAGPERLADDRYAGRWEPASGDFFHVLPPAGDIYLLKRIIHDWDDTQSLAILRNCRSALRGDARLLIIDAVMQPGNAPDSNKFMDVNIMTLTPGQERTEAELRQLCDGAGLRIHRVIPLPSPATLSIVEVGLVQAIG